MSDPTTLSPRRPKKKKMSAIVSHSGPGDPSRLQPPAVHGALAQRKGTSMVGLKLADLNQQLCTAMFGVVLGEPSHCTLAEKETTKVKFQKNYENKSVLVFKNFRIIFKSLNQQGLQFQEV